MLAVRPPQVTSERASLGIDDAGVSAEGTGTSVVSVSGKVKYDLPDPIAELQDAVGLTRGTIKAILEGCSRLDEFEIDPATFLAQVGDKINRVKNDLIAQGIKYVRLPEDEWYTMRDLELDDYTAYLGQNAWKPDMTSKSPYNYVVYDSAGSSAPLPRLSTSRRRFSCSRNCPRRSRSTRRSAVTTPTGRTSRRPTASAACTS